VRLGRQKVIRLSIADQVCFAQALILPPLRSPAWNVRSFAAASSYLLNSIRPKAITYGGRDGSLVDSV
jgi:hypothetical protein